MGISSRLPNRTIWIAKLRENCSECVFAAHSMILFSDWSAIHARITIYFGFNHPDDIRNISYFIGFRFRFS